MTSESYGIKHKFAQLGLTSRDYFPKNQPSQFAPASRSETNCFLAPLYCVPLRSACLCGNTGALIEELPTFLSGWAKCK